jgi:Arm DNA-binding domain
VARRKTLTDASVAELKPKAKRYNVVDPSLPGFYVRVTPNGAKSFVAVTKDPNGKIVWTTIGKTALYSVEEARAKARDTIKAVRAGEMAFDPAHLVSRYFSNLDGFGTKDLRNQYVSDLKARGYRGTRRPRGWPPNLDLDGLYAKMVTRCE